MAQGAAISVKSWAWTLRSFPDPMRDYFYNTWLIVHAYHQGPAYAVPPQAPQLLHDFVRESSGKPGRQWHPRPSGGY